MRFSRILLFIPALIMVIGGFQIFFLDDYDYFYVVLAGGMGIASILVADKPIDWWWYNRNPPALDSFMIALLERNVPFYQSLNSVQKEKFQNRLSLYTLGREFIPMGVETVPYDLKGLFAAQVISMTWNKKEFLLDPFLRIVFYQHPFLSPQYPETAHTSEIETSDGVFIFSLEQLIPGIESPESFFPTGLYEVARAYLHIYPGDRIILEEYVSTRLIEELSGFTIQSIENTVGIKPINETAVLLSMYFSRTKIFRHAYPKQFEAIDELFAPNA